MNKKSSIANKVVNYIVLIFIALVFMFPLIWMIVSSFKTDAQIFSDISSLKAFALSFQDDVFVNYKQVVQKLPLLQAMLHSFGYIAVTIFLSLIVNSMA